MKHTETPWKVKVTEPNEHHPRGFIEISSGSDEKYTSRGIITLSNTETQKANAAHIVKCVNLHEELIEALKHALEVGTFSDEFESHLIDLLKRARERV